MQSMLLRVKSVWEMCWPVVWLCSVFGTKLLRLPNWNKALTNVEPYIEIRQRRWHSILSQFFRLNPQCDNSVSSIIRKIKRVLLLHQWHRLLSRLYDRRLQNLYAVCTSWCILPLKVRGCTVWESGDQCVKLPLISRW